eukprot:COSAG02_NODE_316_length_24889_cov_9.418556_2_plen_105_part_00
MVGVGASFRRFRARSLDSLHFCPWLSTASHEIPHGAKKNLTPLETKAGRSSRRHSSSSGVHAPVSGATVAVGLAGRDATGAISRVVYNLMLGSRDGRVESIDLY